MNRQFSPQTQGIVCIAVGVATVLVEGVIVLTDAHLDNFILTRAPVVFVVGVVLIVLGVLRLRSKITN